MTIITLLENTTNDDLMFKRKTYKNFIKKSLKESDNFTKTLNELKTEILTKYYKKSDDFDLDLSFSVKEIEENQEITINLVKTKKLTEKELKREKLKKALRDRKKNKKNQMTHKQYMKKKKEDKKLMRNDSRVSDEMIQSYNKLCNTMPNAAFPSPVDVLNDKEKHMQDLVKFLIMTRQMIGSDPLKLQAAFNSPYVNYMGLVLGIDVQSMIQNILQSSKKI